MTKVYCSISKTVVFKNFVPKQGLIGEVTYKFTFMLCLMRKIFEFFIKKIYDSVALILKNYNVSIFYMPLSIESRNIAKNVGLVEKTRQKLYFVFKVTGRKEI
jgi:hypothetical protein